MSIEKEKPFRFQRGKCSFQGSSESDRRMLKLEIVLHWTWKIFLAAGMLAIIFLRNFF